MEKIIAVRILYYDEYASGRLAIRKEKRIVKPVEPTNLRDIWISQVLTFDLFKSLCTDNRLLSDDGKQWINDSLSIIETYNFLAANKIIKPGLNRTEVYNVFKGSFKLIKVHNARSLRNREKNMQKRTYRDRQKKFKSFLENLFYNFLCPQTTTDKTST